DLSNSGPPTRQHTPGSTHPSALLTHKLLRSGAFALSHICRELLYDSRSLKRHQRNIVVHDRLLFLTIFHRRYYRKSYKKATW
ncbi:mCG145855, partial [Mus musculus]